MNSIRHYLYNRYGYAIDDVVQETYLRLFRALEKNRLEDEDKLESYIYSIAKNESLRMNNRLYKEELKYKRYLEKYINASIPETEDENNVRDDIIKILNVNKGKIPEKYHEILALYFMGNDFNEISLKLNIKKGTVKTRTYRGIRLLRSLVQANGRITK